MALVVLILSLFPRIFIIHYVTPLHVDTAFSPGHKVCILKRGLLGSTWEISMHRMSFKFKCHTKPIHSGELRNQVRKWKNVLLVRVLPLPNRGVKHLSKESGVPPCPSPHVLTGILMANVVLLPLLRIPDWKSLASSLKSAKKEHGDVQQSVQLPHPFSASFGHHQTS